MTRCLLCAAVLVSLTVVAGCSVGGRTIRPPSVNAAKAAQAAMEEYDADKDGKISAAELDKCPALKSAAKYLDPKREGITADVIQATIRGWQTRGIGRVVYTCIVLHNDKPLEGATVKFVPEKFLGANFPGAVGTTIVDGGVGMSIPDVDPRGVAVGFYRVEISKEGENIPAQYNTETTLGVGIIRPPSSEGMPETFNLKY
jgi:hypothetical protein